MNNFYFQVRGIADFAGEFYRNGGRTLLIDQVFKEPNWANELRQCYDLYPELKIVFTGSSVMRLKEENSELKGIVKSYNLRGFSFREFLNLQTGNKFKPYTLEDIIENHEHIVREILPYVSPLKYFQDYLHHGYYPFFREHRNYSENLLKTMNMMTEVDILFIKQIELKYLAKIKKLFYLLAVNGDKAPNISKLASAIETSRATVMNYIKYLADARLLNIIYHQGSVFPKKPAMVVVNNPNLIYTVYPRNFGDREILNSFFINQLRKDHTVNKERATDAYRIDGETSVRISAEGEGESRSRGKKAYYTASSGLVVGKGRKIPLWLFGFLY